MVQPLAPAKMSLIAWRLRDVSKPESRFLMTGLHTCANCHSFAADGKTMGMDVDGPGNDKGLYAVVPVSQHMTIRNEDTVSGTGICMWGSRGSDSCRRFRRTASMC